MYETVKKIVFTGFNEWIDGKYKSKTDWIMAQSSQVVAVASQIIWTLNTEESIIENEKTGEEIEKNL
jgi:dynein heavy chain